MTASAPVVWGDLVITGTSNGQDEEGNVPSPDAPAIIALDKKTGELVWSDNSVGANVLHGQWSSPAAGEIGGVAQVVMGQGDGWVRSYEAHSGKKLWEFDTNPKDAVWPRTRNNVISTPVILNNRIYIPNGQDPEHGEGVGHLYCIDGTKRGDITESGLVWHYDEIRRSISSAAIHDGLLYIPDYSGFLHCLDVETGEKQWVHDTFAAVWGSPLVADDKVYLGDEDGDVVVLKAGRTEEPIEEINILGSVYGTPVPANGVLFIASHDHLYALHLDN
jgi:outer membrane protein assembly factor BamB